jgi:hypothetical protein
MPWRLILSPGRAMKLKMDSWRVRLESNYSLVFQVKSTIEWMMKLIRYHKDLKKILSVFGKHVVDVEINRECEKNQTVVSRRSHEHVSEATCLGRDDEAMKLPKNVVPYDPSKDEQGNSYGNSIRQEFITIFASLAEFIIKCSIDCPNTQVVDNEDDLNLP